MSAKKKKSGLDFESSLKKLEEIVKRLEDEQAPLEESLKLFAEGKSLARRCEAELAQAEIRVRQLMESGESEFPDAPPGPDGSARSESEDKADEAKARPRDDLPF